jgi:hypothetical protein
LREKRSFRDENCTPGKDIFLVNKFAISTFQNLKEECFVNAFGGT